MNIATQASLRKIQRKLDRQRREAEAAIAAMKAGAALYHQLGGRDPGWVLSTGRRIPDDVARIVLFDRHVAGVGDGLFWTRYLANLEVVRARVDPQGRRRLPSSSSCDRCSTSPQ
jgi:hypothetical protein